MSVIPKVQPNGKILLEYSMNLSDFKDLQNSQQVQEAMLKRCLYQQPH